MLATVLQPHDSRKPLRVEKTSGNLATWGPANTRRKVATDKVPDLTYALPGKGSNLEDSDRDSQSSDSDDDEIQTGRDQTAAALAGADRLMAHLDAVKTRGKEMPATKGQWPNRGKSRRASQATVGGTRRLTATATTEVLSEEEQALVMEGVNNVLALYVARPDVFGNNVKVAVKLAEALSGPPSNKSMMELKTVSHYAELYNDLSKSIASLSANAAKMESLSEENSENKGLSNAYLYDEMQSLVKSIRRYFHGLNWAALNSDLKKLARRADVGKAQIATFLSSMKSVREDTQETVLTARYNGEQLLAARQLAMTSQMDKFHTSVTKHAEKMRPSDNEEATTTGGDGQRNRQRIAMLLQNKLEVQERAVELAEMHQRQHGSEPIGQDNQSANKSEEASGPSRPRPSPLSRYESPASPMFYHGHTRPPVSVSSGPLTMPGETPEHGAVHDEDEEERFSNPRFQHLKPIYLKHKTRIQELESALETKEQEVAETRQTISNLMSKRGSGQAEAPGDPSAAKRSGGFAKDLRKRAMLRREKDALLKYLNTTVCEDDPLAAPAAEVAEQAAAKAANKMMVSQAEALREKVGMLQDKLAQMLRDANDVMLDIAMKADSVGMENPCSLDDKLCKSWFLVNPKKPIVQLLETKVQDAIDHAQAGQRGRRQLYAFLQRAVEAFSAEEAMRANLWSTRQQDDARIAEAKAASEKALDALHENLFKLVSAGALVQRAEPPPPVETRIPSAPPSLDSRMPSLQDWLQERDASSAASNRSDPHRLGSKATPKTPAADGEVLHSDMWTQRKEQGQKLLDQQAKVEALRRKWQEIQGISVEEAASPSDSPAGGAAQNTDGKPESHQLPSSKPQRRSELPGHNEGGTDPSSKVRRGSVGAQLKPAVVSEQRRPPESTANGQEEDNAVKKRKPKATRQGERPPGLVPGSEADAEDEDEGEEAHAGGAGAKLVPKGRGGRRGRNRSTKGPQGALSLNEVLKQCESSNRVLRKRRDAKFVLLKQLYAKKGISMDADDMQKPEMQSDKQERVEKEMTSIKEQMRNLTRMVNFWDQRIARATGEDMDPAKAEDELGSTDSDAEDDDIRESRRATQKALAPGFKELLSQAVEDSIRRISKVPDSMDDSETNAETTSGAKRSSGVLQRAEEQQRMGITRPERQRGRLKAREASLNPEGVLDAVTATSLRPGVTGKWIAPGKMSGDSSSVGISIQSPRGSRPSPVGGGPDRWRHTLTQAEAQESSSSSSSSDEEMMQPRRSILDVLPINVRKPPAAKDHWLTQGLASSTDWQEQIRHGDGGHSSRSRKTGHGEALTARSSNKVGFFMERPSGWKKSLAAVGEDMQEEPADWDELLQVSSVGGDGEAMMTSRPSLLLPREESMRATRQSVLELFGVKTLPAATDSSNRGSTVAAQPRKQFEAVLNALLSDEVPVEEPQVLQRGTRASATARARARGSAARWSSYTASTSEGTLSISGHHPQVKKKGKHSFLGGIAPNAHRAFMQRLQTQDTLGDPDANAAHTHIASALPTIGAGEFRSPAGVMNKVLEAIETMDWKPMSNDDRLHFYTSTGLLLQFEELNAEPGEWPALYRPPLNADGQTSVALPPKGDWASPSDDEQQLIRLLARWRHLLLLKYGHAYRAFKGLCPKGSISIALTRIPFVQAHLRLGFTLEEAEQIFDFAAVLHGPTSTQVVRALTRQRFTMALHMAKPVATVMQLRSRLLHRYGKLQVALNRFDVDRDGCLSEREFCSLCASVGCPSQIAQWVFLQTWEANPEPLPGVPRLTPYAFVLTFEEADSLAVMQHLRKQVRPGWTRIVDAIPRLGPESFAGPQNLEEFAARVARLGLTEGDARHLFQLANGEEADDSVYMEHAVLRCFGGLGRHYYDLVEELRARGADNGAPSAQAMLPQELLRDAADAAAVTAKATKVRHLHEAPAQARILMSARHSGPAPGGAGGFAASMVHRRQRLATAQLMDPHWNQTVEGPLLVIQSRQYLARYSDFRGKAMIKANAAHAMRRLARKEAFRTFASGAKAFEAHGHSLRRKLTLAEFRAAVKDFHLPDVLCRDLYLHLGSKRETGLVTLGELVHAVKVQSHMEAMPGSDKLVWRRTSQGTILRNRHRQTLLQCYKELENILRSVALADGTGIHRPNFHKALRRIGLAPPLQHAILTQAYRRQADEHIALPLAVCLRLVKDLVQHGNSLTSEGLASVEMQRSSLQSSGRKLSRASAPSRRESSAGSGEAHASSSASDGRPRTHGSDAGSEPSKGRDTSPGGSTSSSSSVDGARPTVPGRVLRRRLRRASSHRSIRSAQTRRSSRRSTKSAADENQTGVRPHFPSDIEDLDAHRQPKGLRRKEATEGKARLNVRLTEEQLKEQHERERRLADLRVLVFAEPDAYERAVRDTREFRQKLLRRSPTVHAALALLRSEGQITGNIIHPAGFQAIANRLHISTHDSERIFKVIELIEGKKPVTSLGFIVAMHFAAPVNSAFDLRTHIVHRYGALAAGLAALHEAMYGTATRVSAGFTSSMLQDALLPLLGIERRTAECLFQHLDVRRVSQVRFRDLEIALEEPAAFVLLEGLHAHLLRLAPSIEAGLGSTGLFEDRVAGLDAVVDAGKLEALGVPNGYTEAVLRWLRHTEPGGGDITLRTLLRQLHAFDRHILRGTGLSRRQHDELMDHFAGRPPRTAKALEQGGVVFSESDDQALDLWRRVKDFMHELFGSGATPQDVFSTLDLQGAGVLSLEDWVNGWAAAGLTDGESARCLFGLLVGWRHSQWMRMADGEEDPTVSAADLARGLRLAAPITTLRNLRARLQEEYGSLSKAYEKLCDGSHTVCYRSWMAGLHTAWVTHAEAAPWFVLFEKDTDGRVSHTAFSKMLLSPDSTIAVRNLCAQLVQDYGCSAAAFELFDLTRPLDSKDFRNVCAMHWGLPAVEGQAVFSYISHQPDASILLSDLLDSLAAMEEQHHWWLLPLSRRHEPGRNLSKNATAIASSVLKKLAPHAAASHGALPQAATRTKSEGKRSAIPRMEMIRRKRRADQEAEFRAKPSLPQSARHTSFERSPSLASSRRAKGALALPRIGGQLQPAETNEAARLFVENFKKEQAPQTDAPQADGAEENNARHWTRHAVERFLHSSPSEQVDGELLATVAQSLGVDVVAAAARAGARVGPAAAAPRRPAPQTLPAVLYGTDAARTPRTRK